ncbi:MAG: 4Fe-4S dicluster domain-containing protein [Bdellovibrionales bacterium]|nr:4Fe-4S dicluster domain-containing protein [Bdellovibrionales bacterium]
MISVFSGLAQYLKAVFRGLSSVLGSVKTSLPYLVGFKSGELRKEVTEQYPDPVSSKTPEDLPARSRGLLFNDIERCTGCRDCEQICPVKCITVENEKGPDSQKVWVSVFDIDSARCTFCGLCVEVCQPQSLIHSHQFESAVYASTDLVASFGRGRVTQEQRVKWAKARQEEEHDGEVVL